MIDETKTGEEQLDEEIVVEIPEEKSEGKAEEAKPEELKDTEAPVVAEETTEPEEDRKSERSYHGRGAEGISAGRYCSYTKDLSPCG